MFHIKIVQLVLNKKGLNHLPKRKKSSRKIILPCSSRPEPTDKFQSGFHNQSSRDNSGVCFA